MNELLICCMDSCYLKSTCVYYYIFNTGVNGIYFYINRCQRKTETKRQDWKKYIYIYWNQLQVAVTHFR